MLVRRLVCTKVGVEEHVVAHFDTPECWFLQTRDTPHRARLAAARLTEEHERLPVADFQIKVAHGHVVAVLQREPLYCDVHCSSPSS
jgi:hypothetical protein